MCAAFTQPPGGFLRTNHQSICRPQDKPGVVLQHYPNRLHQLFIVGLPPQLRWVLATLKPLLQPETKQKIRSISVSDPDLPLPESVLSPGFESITEEVTPPPPTPPSHPPWDNPTTDCRSEVDTSMDGRSDRCLHEYFPFEVEAT